MSEHEHSDAHEEDRAADNDRIAGEAAVGEAATDTEPDTDTLGDQVAGAGGGPGEEVTLPDDVMERLYEEAEDITPDDVDALPQLTPEQKYEVKQNLSISPMAAGKLVTPEDDPNGTRAVIQEWVEYNPEEDSPEAIEERERKLQREQGMAEVGIADGGEAADMSGDNTNDEQDRTEQAVAEASQWAADLVANNPPEVCLVYLAALSTTLAEQGVTDGE